MHDQAVAFAVADNFFKNSAALFEAAVDVCTGISFCHGFEVARFVGNVPHARISGTSHESALTLEFFEGVAESNPDSDTFPGNTGFFVFTESPFLISYFFVQFFEEFIERDFRVVQGAGSNGEAHVVEEVEAVERRRFVLEVRSDFVPGSDGALCLFLYFEEFVIVEGTAAEVFELFDSVFEFADDVLFSVFRNREFMVERYVDVDERYVQFFSQVFIPFEQGIADVVASEDNIRKGNRRSRGVFEDFRRFACQRSSM